MLGRNLLNIYKLMHDIGFVKSKRHFAMFWLGRGKTYLRDFEFRPDRLDRPVSRKTIAALRQRLEGVARYSSTRVAGELREVIRQVDEACRICEWLRRGR